MNTKSTGRMVTLSLLLAGSILLQMLEPAVPVGVPGVKWGLANIMGLMVLYLYGPNDMIFVNILRVILCGILKGTLFATAFWLSLSGVLLSTFGVILLHKRQKNTIVGISIAGSALHLSGQILAIMVIYRSVYVMVWLPVMWICGIGTGMLTGFLTKDVLKRIQTGGKAI